MQIKFFVFGLAVSLSVLIMSCRGNESDRSGTIVESSIDSEILERKVQYIQYNPFMRDSMSKPSPILYLLHGHGGDHLDWFQETEGNVASILDSLIEAKLIPPVVAVSIDAGNSWYVDRHDKMETFYISEFIPEIERQIGGTLSRRILAGNSAGGYGSLRFVMKFPDLFDEVILLSPAAYNPLPPAISSSRKIDVFAEEGVFNDSIWKSYSYLHL
ncbi:MAG: hypothetical protein HKN48_12390, partial [Flavobacteriaceae bacterium]|nr:hypothetical protein [Flavobacteriaceae bacterium]